MKSEALEEARHLFEQAERETDPLRKLAVLEEALDLTDDLRMDPAADARAISFVNSLRQSHLRRLVSQVVTLRHIQFDVWFNYIKLLFLRVGPEIEAILAGDPQLRESHRSFTKIWKDELLKMLQRA